MATDDHEHPAITPDMKIGTLIREYPDLEEVLIALSPEFAKLRNPILRRTVAKVATLRQAAALGKLSLGELINTLRRHAGQTNLTGDAIRGEQGESAIRPEWVDRLALVQSLDARNMLDRGEHPMTEVLTSVRRLSKGERYELVSPFLPAPLIDAMRKQGFLVWSEQEAAELFRTHVTLGGEE